MEAALLGVEMTTFVFFAFLGMAAQPNHRVGNDKERIRQGDVFPLERANFSDSHPGHEREQRAEFARIEVGAQILDQAGLFLFAEHPGRRFVVAGKDDLNAAKTGKSFGRVGEDRV